MKICLAYPLVRISAFRPCGRELAEFFESTGWPLYVQVDNFGLPVMQALWVASAKSNFSSDRDGRARVLSERGVWDSAFMLSSSAQLLT